MFEKRPNLFISDCFICFVSLTGSIKYLCVSLGSENISLCETFHDFSSFPEALLNRFHSDEPLMCVLKTLLIRHLVVGCTNENSCRSSLFSCNVLRSLFNNVLAHTVNIIHDRISKMFSRFNPWQFLPT